MWTAGSFAEAFDRDCCVLLENRFFARGQGIELDDQAVQILRDAQPDKPGIDNYAVFGLTANKNQKAYQNQFCYFFHGMIISIRTPCQQEDL